LTLFFYGRRVPAFSETLLNFCSEDFDIKGFFCGGALSVREEGMEANNLKVEEFLDGYTQTLSEEMGLAARKEKMDIPVITLSMQPGSGGYGIAKRLALRLGFDFFNKEILKPMAACNDVNPIGLEMVEKYRMKGFEDFISLLLNNEYIHPDQYFRYLKEFVSILGRVGKSVIVGRGVNFILPKEKRFAVRIIAPLETRVKNVAFAFGVSLDEARKRIKNRAAKRSEFVKHNFHEDIEDSLHYDLIINTSRLDTESTVDTIIGTIIGAQFNHPFEKAESFILRKRR
jgi:cytidylate kinase